MTAKKRKNPPEEPFKEALLKPDSQFIADYLQDEWLSEWTHPTTGAKYTISLVKAPEISADDLLACFELIKETSFADYNNSRGGWHPAKKMIEMKSRELKYILIKGQDENEGSLVRGFTSLMPTFEEGQPVIYCYEIHLKPELQG